jgi:hypothetical protein
MQLSATQQRALCALADRIVPADDYPSASELGALAFATNLFNSDLASAAAPVTAGLISLDAEAVAVAGTTFAEMTGKQQDTLLTALLQGETHADWKTSAAAFVRLMIVAVNEGYYADPENGGNAGGASWKMVGFEHREGMRLLPEGVTV